IDVRAAALASNFVIATCCYWPTSAVPCVCSGSTTQQNYGTPHAQNTADHTPPYAYFSTIGLATAGATFPLNLAVAGSSGQTYIMAASGATGPPIYLSDGRAIDLAADVFMIFSLTPGNGIFFNFTGVMSALGVGQGQVTLPNVPGLAGLGFYAAGLTLDP